MDIKLRVGEWYTLLSDSFVWGNLTFSIYYDT
jgi:hypothetical protein